MFPHIECLDDLLPFIKDNRQIRVKQEDNGLTVVCYMVQDEDTFAGDHTHARECRGITFHPDGTIAARNLHKFFNVGEREDTQPNAIDWSRVTRITPKRDGSMVTPVVLSNGSIVFKTKKTFDSKEAQVATELLHAVDNGQQELEWVRRVLSAGLTPTFEFTSPRFPIVVLYEKDELTLLHVRENVSGRYLSEEEIASLNPPFPMVENLIGLFSVAKATDTGVANLVDWDLLKRAAETTEDIEGWVIQFDDGEMVKLKTAWYVALHHAVSFTRWRDIARAVAADQSDDLKGAFALTGRSIEPILKVEHAIKVKIEEAIAIVVQLAEEGRAQCKSQKEMAMIHSNHPLFSLIMREFGRRENDWMAWYVKNQLESDWGLEVVEINIPDA